MYKKFGKIIAEKKNVDVIEACVKIGEPVLLVGETGTGKTTLLSELAKKKKKNIVRVSVNGSTGIEEILGKWLVEKSTTFWQDGILISAMKNGDWIVFDELNSALPEILFSLHSLLDDEKSVTLTEKDNEVIRPHKDFRFFGSMNPSEEYAGTKEMNKAFLSRFNAVLNIDLLPANHEIKAIVLQSKIESLEATQLVEIATKLRKKKKSDDIFYFCSTRDLIQAGKLIKGGIKFDDAIKFSIFNKMSKDELDVVKNDIKKVQTMFEENKDKYISILESGEKYKDIELDLDNTKQDLSKSMAHNEHLVQENDRINSAYIRLSETMAEQLRNLAEGEIKKSQKQKIEVKF